MRALSTLVRYKEKRSKSLISQNTALVPAKHFSGNSSELYRDNGSSKKYQANATEECKTIIPYTFKINFFCIARERTQKVSQFQQ